MNRLSAEQYSASPKHPLVLMLHNIRSMWNVGSMFRTADAAGIEKMILSGYTATPPRKEIDKTALGAQDTVCWEYHADPLLRLFPAMKKNGVRICGLEITEGSRPYTALSLLVIFRSVLLLAMKLTVLKTSCSNCVTKCLKFLSMAPNIR